MNVTDAVKPVRSALFPDPCFLFDGLSRTDRERALAILLPSFPVFALGQKIVSAGEPGGRLFFLLSGLASVYRTGGEKPVLMNRLRTGDCFGAASLYTDGPTPTEITAETECRLAVVREPELSRLFLAFPATATNFIRFLTRKLVFLNRRVRDFSAATSDEKTACLLLNEADEDGVAVLKNVTAILKTMNLSRASFYRSLTSFFSRGLIEKNGNQIKIINSKELKGILS